MSRFATPYIRYPVNLNEHDEVEGNYKDYFTYDDLDLYRLEVNLPSYLPKDRGLISVIEHVDNWDEREEESCSSKSSCSTKTSCSSGSCSTNQDKIDDKEQLVERIYVRILDNRGDLALLTSNEKIDIENAIQEICTPRNGQKGFLYVSSLTPDLISTNGVLIPPEWSSQMLRRAPFQDQQVFFHERGMYVNFVNGNFMDVKKQHELFIMKMVKWLQNKYDQGALPFIIAESFASDWNLEMNSEHLWVPIYYNPHVMDYDSISFYTQRVKRVGSAYRWTTPVIANRGEQDRFEAILKNNGNKYYKSQERFVVTVRNYEEAKNLMQIFYYA